MLLRNARRAIAALALLGIVGLAACGVAQSSPRGSPSARPGPSGATPVRPHFQRLPDGRALASGWLRRIGLEGGFWALIAQPPGDTTANPTVVAVLLPGRVSEAEIVAHDGAYLIAKGKLATGASIRISGPEIVVRSVTLLKMGQ